METFGILPPSQFPFFVQGTGRPSDDFTPQVHAHVGRTDAPELASAVSQMASRSRQPADLGRSAKTCMANRTTVLLYEMNGFAIIIASPTGVIYRNQTGGHGCLQSEMEGYLIPIGGDLSGECNRLHSHFIGPKWGGWCAENIDHETANEVDNFLAEIHRDEIVVDREKLSCSWESWVHVQINRPLQGLIEHSSPTSGILTWPNSD